MFLPVFCFIRLRKDSNVYSNGLRQNTTKKKAKQGILNRGRGHETELKNSSAISAPIAGRMRNKE
jgi:hypothetical protein